jgi:hypothetical protein
MRYRPSRYHSFGYDYDDTNTKQPKIKSFKNFDYGDYVVDDDKRKVKKRDGILKKLAKKIYKISTMEEVRWAAGLLLSAWILSGRASRRDSTTEVLRDIQSGRVDFDTLENARETVIDTYQKMKK